MLRAVEAEARLGLEYFLTDTPPLGGKIKEDPEDFYVEEIPINYPRFESPPRQNPQTVVRIEARLWESNRLFDALRRVLGIGSRRLRFSGTKDRRAVTVQDIYISGYIPRDDVMRINRLGDVRVIDVAYTNRKLSMGDLIGNRFKIVIRDIAELEGDSTPVIEEAIRQIEANGGVPNFYGIQRFGIIRPITHHVGRYLVERNYEKAVMTYVANPLDTEEEEIREARKRLERNMDFADALEYYPEKMSFEKRMIGHLAEHPDDWIGALNTLPYNLKLMFVHSYQSYVFNRILSRRMEKGMGINEPTIGDIAVSLDSNGLPHHKKGHKVNERNIRRLQVLCRRNRVFITALVPGYDVDIAGGDMGDIESSILEEEGIDLSLFRMPDLPDISSSGIRRELVCPLKEFEYQHSPADRTLTLSFSLNKGCYATVVTREFMKSEDLMDY